MWPCPWEKGEQLYCFILTSVKSGLEVSRSFNVKWKNLNYCTDVFNQGMGLIHLVYVDLSNWWDYLQSFSFMTGNIPLLQDINRIHWPCSSSMHPEWQKGSPSGKEVHTSTQDWLWKGMACVDLERDPHAQETALSSDHVHFYRLPLYLLLYLIELSSFSYPRTKV